MDEPQHATTIWQSGIWDAVRWLLGVLVAGMAEMARRAWKQQERRIEAVELRSEAAHKQRIADLADHVSVDSAAHESLRKELSSELRLVYDKLDTTNAAGEERAKTLSLQMATQHGQITERIDKVLGLMVTGKGLNG